MRLYWTIAALVAASFTTGCSTTSTVAQYKASTRNVMTIQDYVGSSDRKVKLNNFTAAPGVNESMWCRAMGPISVGSGKTPAQFIHDALEEELFLGKAYSDTARDVISGHVDEIKFSSVSPANWEIALTLSSSTGTSYQTKAKFDFDTSWDAISACKNVADAFSPAVQETLKKAVSDGRFKALMVKN